MLLHCMGPRYSHIEQIEKDVHFFEECECLQRIDNLLVKIILPENIEDR